MRQSYLLDMSEHYITMLTALQKNVTCQSVIITLLMFFLSGCKNLFYQVTVTLLW